MRKSYISEYPNYAKDARHLADLVRQRRNGENVEQQYQQALQKFLRENKERQDKK